jgi:hypothetical protein
MTKQKINLKNIEKESWKRTFVEDGLFDIMLGVSFLTALASSLFGTDYSLIPIFVILIASYITVRKYVIIPRIGTVKFGAERIKKKGWVTGVLVLSVLFLGLMTFLTKSGIFPSEGLPISSILVGFNILIVLSLMGYFLNFNRLYLYGALIGLGEPIGTWLEKTGRLQDGSIVVGIISAIVIVIGIVTFIKFLKKYPLPKKEQ